MRIGVAIEYSIGHRTHAQNLEMAAKGLTDVDLTMVRLPFDDTPVPAWLNGLGPLSRNWTVRSSLAAYQGLKNSQTSFQSLFFHTQVTTLFAGGLMRRTPSVISLDATPAQVDAMASYYHGKVPKQIERVKSRILKNSLAKARGIVAWTEWTRRDLVDRYGVSSERIAMIPPGVDCAKWCFDRAVPRKGAVRFLFVGGDFVRKGGPLLVEAFKTVRDVVPGCVLDIVTMSHVVTSAEGITVHNGLKPNTPDLMRLYSNADVFVFPTRGDCFPLAVLEALSSGLPVITSDIGAIREAVIPNQGGLVVAVDD
jgi:glycosyltransferase involved in cell wall biosynthesis